jgi:hypothetical protein
MARTAPSERGAHDFVGAVGALANWAESANSESASLPPGAALGAKTLGQVGGRFRTALRTEHELRHGEKLKRSAEPSWIALHGTSSRGNLNPFHDQDGKVRCLAYLEPDWHD